MNYFVGFLVWIGIGLVAAIVARFAIRAAATAPIMTFVFGIFGAFVGGMLGVSAYVFHDPEPLRFGGWLGAIIGSLFFTSLYHVMARKAI